MYSPLEDEIWVWLRLPSPPPSGGVQDSILVPAGLVWLQHRPRLAVWSCVSGGPGSLRAVTADKTFVGFILYLLRIDSTSGRCESNDCWSLSSVLIVLRANVCLINRHSVRRILRIGEEMLRCNCKIATTANFVVLSIGFGWPWPHRFRHHVTWLILPVVICLSQRLSHACLSISVSLRNCEWLIKTVIVSMSVVYYLDIHGNSRANTCVQTRLLRKGCAY